MSWADCERLLLEAKRGPKEPFRSATELLFVDDLVPQASWLPLDQGPLEALLQLRVGEVCEVYGPPAAGKTQLGLTAALSAQRPVVLVTAKDEPRLLAERLREMARCRQVRA